MEILDSAARNTASTAATRPAARPGVGVRHYRGLPTKVPATSAVRAPAFAIAFLHATRNPDDPLEAAAAPKVGAEPVIWGHIRARPFGRTTHLRLVPARRHSAAAAAASWA